MKFQILFSGKNKKNIIHLPSAEFAWRAVMATFSYIFMEKYKKIYISISQLSTATV